MALDCIVFSKVFSQYRNKASGGRQAPLICNVQSSVRHLNIHKHFKKDYDLRKIYVRMTVTQSTGEKVRVLPAEVEPLGFRLLARYSYASFTLRRRNVKTFLLLGLPSTLIRRNLKTQVLLFRGAENNFKTELSDDDVGTMIM